MVNLTIILYVLRFISLHVLSCIPGCITHLLVAGFFPGFVLSTKDRFVFLCCRYFIVTIDFIRIAFVVWTNKRISISVIVVFEFNSHA